MAKKSKFLSWFGLGKKEQENAKNEEQVTSSQSQEDTQDVGTADNQEVTTSEVTNAPREADAQATQAETKLDDDATVTDEASTPHTHVEASTVVTSDDVKEELTAESTQATNVDPIIDDAETIAVEEKDALEDEAPAEETSLNEAEQADDTAQSAEPKTESNTEQNTTTERDETNATSEVTPEQNDVVEAVTAEPTEAALTEAEENTELATNTQPENTKAEKKLSFFARLKEGLKKTKTNLGAGFSAIFSGKKIDDELFEELETQLLMADVGVDTTMKLIDSLTDSADRKQLKDGDALFTLMQEEMGSMLKQAEQPLTLRADNGPFVILMVGVNGVGKTTTIGKLAKQFQSQGKSVMLAAGDTFRAAAVEQLQVWGERNDIPVIAQHTGADSASVVFDAFQAAKARNVDVLIADTAGRLQNKDNLMQELEKIARVMKKIDADAPHEVMLTIDAGTGQNAMSQVELFNKAVGLTGITLTKLDGTAKGGVIFAVADKFDIPIRYIGVGEGIDDLRPFESDDFIKALFNQ